MVEQVLSGRYRRLRDLGRGGMGEVWLAYDELLHREVAVKRIHSSYGPPDAVALERLIREARLAARLDHPNAVTVHDLVIDQGFPHLVMQYVRGRTLADVMADGPIPLPEAARIIGTVASALAEAHALGIVHRDVKPANILIDDRRRAMLADFGIARSESDSALTQTGFFIGTPDFLAPEIVRGAGASPASDVYALGGTLFAALEGRPPFGSDGHHTLAVLARILTEAPPSATRAGPLAGLIEAMLAPDPALRPTAQEVVRRVSAWASSGDVTRLNQAMRSDEAERTTGPTTDDHDVVAPTTVRRPTPAEATPMTFRPELIEPHRSPAPVPADPAESLMGAILATNQITDGWSGSPDEWSDLVVDELLPNLRFDDGVDLFVPTLFALDPSQTAGLPRRVVRSLRTLRAGATMTLGDRLVCAWNGGAWGADHLALTIEYRSVAEIVPTVYEEDGEDFHTLELRTSRFVFPILFSNQWDLTGLRHLLAERIVGRSVPRWDDGWVAEWRTVDMHGQWQSRPGWPRDV